MRELEDCLQELPYRGVVPWPLIELNGQWDWISSVNTVESWLDHYVGYHYRDWTWTQWTLHQPNLCSVSFAREPDSVLFLLRFGS
jgi:hypothetical protein